MTREAMAAFLYRLEGGTPPRGEQVYVDSSRSRDHEGAIEWLATQGVSEGWVTWEGRVYRPFEPVQRFAMAAFLYRLKHGAPPFEAVEPRLEPEKYVWVTASTLHLRSKPTWGSDVVVTGDRHAKARFLGARVNGWMRVQMGRMIAWAPSDYLTDREPNASPKRVGMAVNELWFRDGPSNGHSVLKKVRQGTRGTLTGISKGNWEWVSVDGVLAWAPSVHLNDVKSYNPNPVMSRAYSQVGIRGGNYNNKYSAWYGTTNPYCMVFVMWTFHHAGFPNHVPHRGLYSDWAAVLQRSGVLDENVSRSDLKRGHVALVDWAPRYGPTHTGIVSRVDGDYVWLVEGNTTDGTGDPSRGVFERRRAIADIDSVFDPDDYARSIGY